MKIALRITLNAVLIGLLTACGGQNDKLQSNGPPNDKPQNESPQSVRIRMYDDKKSMKEELLKFVPVGSSVQDAKRIMEENGFACEMYTNDSSIETFENDPLSERTITHDNADFCYCDKRRTPFQLVAREWKVMVVHKNNVVSDIYVNTGLTGP